MYKTILRAAVVVIAALAVSAAWGGETKEIYRAAIDSSGVQKISMEAGSYYFKPAHIVVKVNVPVEITIRKESGFIPHDIVLHAPEAGIDFKADLSTEPKVIRFIPTKTGTYPFYCSKRFLFWTHRAKGMEGVLEVVG